MESIFDQTAGAFRKRGFKAECFADRTSALEAILSEISDEESVGIGGSMTVKELGLDDLLIRRGNHVAFHWREDTPEKMGEAKKRARDADVYISSANSLSRNGDIVNIDGQGNRVASMIYGHKKVLILCGRNKIRNNLDSALKFARDNAYKNARRLKLKTPCAVTGVCSDCGSPDRICRVTTIIERLPMGADIRIFLIDEELGF
jgi:hypothetical protein